MKRTFIIALLLLGIVSAGFDIKIDRDLLKEYLNDVLYRISDRYDAMRHMWLSFWEFSRVFKSFDSRFFRLHAPRMLSK